MCAEHSPLSSWFYPCCSSRAIICVLCFLASLSCVDNKQLCWLSSFQVALNGVLNLGIDLGFVVHLNAFVVRSSNPLCCYYTEEPYCLGLQI